jgi:hypothetical protein
MLARNPAKSATWVCGTCRSRKVINYHIPKLHRLVKNLITQATTGADVVDEHGKVIHEGAGDLTAILAIYDRLEGRTGRPSSDSATLRRAGDGVWPVGSTRRPTATGEGTDDYARSQGLVGVSGVMVCGRDDGGGQMRHGTAPGDGELVHLTDILLALVLTDREQKTRRGGMGLQPDGT